MSKTRLEAFSDAVIAILITIMVLELRVPHESGLAALRPLAPTFLAYVLSFVNLGLYWNNHHHLLHAATRVNGRILWANMHLLFWLSLFPFTTAWMGEHYRESLPVAVYGGVAIAAAIAYTILVRELLASEGPASKLARAIGRDVKGYASLTIYAVAILTSYVVPRLAEALYAVVAMIWFVPDRRIESRIV